MVTNLQKAAKLARRTDQLRGWTSNDKRSLIHSIVLATLPTTKVGLHQIAEQLEIPWSTYRQIVKAVHPSQRQLEDPNMEITKISQVRKRKGWTRIDAVLKEKIYTYIRNYQNIRRSPIKGDYVRIPDPTNPLNKIKKTKLLLEVPV